MEVLAKNLGLHLRFVFKYDRTVDVCLVSLIQNFGSCFIDLRLCLVPVETHVSPRLPYPIYSTLKRKL